MIFFENVTAIYIFSKDKLLLFQDYDGDEQEAFDLAYLKEEEEKKIEPK